MKCPALHRDQSPLGQVGDRRGHVGGDHGDDRAAVPQRRDPAERGSAGADDEHRASGDRQVRRSSPGERRPPCSSADPFPGTDDGDRLQQAAGHRRLPHRHPYPRRPQPGEGVAASDGEPAVPQRLPQVVRRLADRRERDWSAPARTEPGEYPRPAGPVRPVRRRSTLRCAANGRRWPARPPRGPHPSCRPGSRRAPGWTPTTAADAAARDAISVGIAEDVPGPQARDAPGLGQRPDHQHTRSCCAARDSASPGTASMKASSTTSTRPGRTSPRSSAAGCSTPVGLVGLPMTTRSAPSRDQLRVRARTRRRQSGSPGARRGPPFAGPPPVR